MQANASHVITDKPGSIAPLAASRWQEVAEEVIQFHNFVLEHSRRSRDNAKLALGVALNTGNFLLSVKEQLAHGEWTPWLREYLPDISHSTINRYMRVARRMRERGSPGIGRTLIDAYRGAGILPTKKKAATIKPGDTPVKSDPVHAVRKSISSLRRALRKWKGDQKRKEAPSSMTEATRSDLKRLRDEIDGVLSECEQAAPGTAS